MGDTIIMHPAMKEALKEYFQFKKWWRYIWKTILLIQFVIIYTI
jgi:hypothetical protein